MHIGTPARRGHAQLGAGALDRVAELLQRPDDVRRFQLQAGQLFDARRIEGDHPGLIRLLPGHFQLADLAAAHLHDHLRGKIDAGTDRLRVDATLEAEARVGMDAVAAAGPGGADRIEIGGFDEDVHRRLGAAGLLAAHDAAEAEHAAVIGNDAGFAVDLIFSAVEREEALARLAEAGLDGAMNLVRVVDVKRAAAVVGNVVGDVDQRVDRAQADRAQALLHPCGRRAVLDAADIAPGE